MTATSIALSEDHEQVLPERAYDLGSAPAVRRWWPVALLCLLYVLALVDRLILAILVQPLKADLNLSDTQIALAVGSSFAFFYSLVGLPVAWAIDRGQRLVIGLAGVVVWSASTMASGFVDSFGLLLMLRIGVAIGEAVLVPLAISLIADLFSPSKRSVPMSFFIASGLVGIFSAYFLGGAIVDLLERHALAGVPVIGSMATWRAALVLTGMPGLVIAAVMALTVRDPKRNAEARSEPETGEHGRFGAFGSTADAWRFYVCFFLGVGLIAMATNSALTWFPTYLVRSFGASLAESGYVFSLSFPAAAAVLLLIPHLMRALQRRGYASALVIVVLSILPVGALLFGLSLVQGSVSAAVPFMIVGYGLLAGGINAIPTLAVGLTAPAVWRGRLVSLGLATITVMGLGIGSYLTAWLAERLFTGPDAIAHALLAITATVTPLAWILIFISWAPYRRARLD